MTAAAVIKPFFLLECSRYSGTVEQHELNKLVYLIFIINGQSVSVEANRHAPLTEAVARALQESGNTGRPPEEWEVRNIQGVLLPQHRTPEELSLTNGTRLFLSLQVGAGGIGKRRSGC